MKAGRFEIGSFLFDSAREQLSLNGKKIRLIGKKRDILKLLIESFPNWITQDEIRAKAWDVSVSARVVPVHVSKLNTEILSGEIDSERHKGYRLKHLTEKPEKEYTFEDVWEGAGKVGTSVFDEPFKANAVLTFAGPSAIFANLVLVNYFSQQRGKLLEIPVYLALQRDWPSSDSKKKLPVFSGYTPVSGEGVVMLVPNALTEFAKRPRKPLRLAVIDDVIMSGAVLACLRPHLQRALGSSAQIKFVCFVCFKPMTEVAEVRKPDYAAEESKTADFTLPWGPPFWFGKNLFPEHNE